MPAQQCLFDKAVELVRTAESFTRPGHPGQQAPVGRELPDTWVTIYISSSDVLAFGLLS